MGRRLGCSALVTVLLGCQAEVVGPVGSWALEGEGWTGAVVGTRGGGCASGGTRVALHGPTLSTRGLVAAEVEADGEGWWLRFPVEGGLGEGLAELRLGDRVARLPLGARQGEHVVVLEAPEATLDETALGEAADAAMARLEAERQAWDAGAFVLLDGDRRVGDLRLRGGSVASLAVYDELWLTEQPVQAEVRADGPDLVLDFPAEPALQGESARIRINAPTRTVVVPSGARPSEMDRSLRLEPGHVDEATRADLVARAKAAADAAEQAWLDELGPVLVEVATAEDGRCRAGQPWPDDLGALLRGYTVRRVDEAGGCVVEIEPELPQHRRRLAGRYTR